MKEKKHPDAQPLRIEIRLNGEAFEVVQNTTIAALVESLGERPERLAIEHNGLIVSRALWSSTELRKGDQVEIVQFVGGGSCLR